MSRKACSKCAGVRSHSDWCDNHPGRKWLSSVVARLARSMLEMDGSDPHPRALDGRHTVALFYVLNYASKAARAELENALAGRKPDGSCALCGTSRPTPHTRECPHGAEALAMHAISNSGLRAFKAAAEQAGIVPEPICDRCTHRPCICDEFDLPAPEVTR